jgi:hypothetical protein
MHSVDLRLHSQPRLASYPIGTWVLLRHAQDQVGPRRCGSMHATNSSVLVSSLPRYMAESGSTAANHYYTL